MIVHLARDIPPFVMYCVYGESGSSLLIESTDSMIISDIIVESALLPLGMLFMKSAILKLSRPQDKLIT